MGSCRIKSFVAIMNSLKRTRDSDALAYGVTIEDVKTQFAGRRCGTRLRVERPLIAAAAEGSRLHFDDLLAREGYTPCPVVNLCGYLSLKLTCTSKSLPLSCTFVRLPDGHLLPTTPACGLRRRAARGTSVALLHGVPPHNASHAAFC